jgi:hypothetical protein
MPAMALLVPVVESVFWRRSLAWEASVEVAMPTCPPFVAKSAPPVNVEVAP